jgi:hypothetical protein
VFKASTPEEKQSAMDEYRAKQQAELDKMARVAGDEVGARRLTISVSSEKLRPKPQTLTTRSER